MAFQSGTIDPNSTTPADDIYKIINDLTVLRSVIGGNTDPAVPSSWEPIHASSTLTTSGTAPSLTVTTSYAVSAYALGLRLRLQFHAAVSSGTPTLNVNGLGAKNLRQYNSAGVKVPAVVVASQLTEVVYDGTDFVLLAALPGQIPASPTFVDLTATGTTSLQSVGVNGAYASNIVSVAAASIDLSLGNYFSTGGVTTAVTYTIVNPPAARAYSFTLEANIGTGGAITFPASVVWPNGVTPTFTAGKTALITFVTDNGGTTYRASAITGYTT